ncbi:hypothetical protein GRI97_10965 [Altererythrobacter xixiisoli]|uniref:Uncharacterized protein n=1 Tax=Croceibacterium xixiisoli TaxID=1476466 RepID=A0A6I4TWB7_9SPHN|nr:hypothetical protein [Croceibacterium xixiisoli]MXO99509.1 hypothetical protein [Croceibacterium xixiisoli]
MGEYEPDDSRIVTQNPSHTPIEPERTGPRESQTRPGRKDDQLAGSKKSADDKGDRWQTGAKKED